MAFRDLTGTLRLSNTTEHRQKGQSPKGVGVCAHQII